MFFVLSRAWDKEKILIPNDESNLMGTQNFFFVPVSWQDGKHLSLLLYRAQNLSSLLLYLQTGYVFENKLFSYNTSNFLRPENAPSGMDESFLLKDKSLYK